MPVLTKDEMITVQCANSLAKAPGTPPAPLTQKLLDIIDRLRQDYRCPACSDLGWIGQENPVQPGVIMGWSPCSQCNPMGKKPNSMMEPLYLITDKGMK